MNRKRVLLVISLLALTLDSGPVWTEQSVADCQIQVTEPTLGQEVAGRAKVEGTAKIPADHHLWVFARHESFRELDVWWPQREGSVAPDTGKWKVSATLGGPQDLGDEFDVAVAVVAEQQDMRIREWFRVSMRAKDYQPIEMPAAVCVSPVLKVKKTRE
ncbi:MAG TPA: hypothetical protein VF756_05885 [Thermoanaerobaculia bacterium]